MTDRTNDVIGLYKPPFHYDRTGQIIYDSTGHRVLDIRGWGRIGYMQGAEELQDGVGERLVAILDAHWTDTKRPARAGESER